MLTLSVVVPVYNEVNTIDKIIRVIEGVPVKKEIIIVDDGSTDGTREIIRQHFMDREGFKVIFHEKNQGKGMAVRNGIKAASAETLIIQDADLEYDPMDYLKLLQTMEREKINVVYGSRFMAKTKVTSFWHRSVNYFLTWLTNLLFYSNLTDMETCYKMFRSSLIKSIDLESDGFEIEVELTAKILKRGEKIVEIPISYKGRAFHEGKKIGWKDGFKAVGTLVRFRLA